MASTSRVFLASRNARARRQERAVELEAQAAGSELPAGGGKTMRKLIRGLSGRPMPRPEAAFCAESFRRFKLQETFLLHADVDVLPNWTSRSIANIIPANEFIFVISEYGHCAAFHHTPNASVVPYKRDDGHINREKIVDLFYHKINDSIITVSTSEERDGYKMIAYQLENIRRHENMGPGIEVFGSWTIDLPFFDYYNSLAVVSLYQDDAQLVNNIYQMTNCELVYSIPGKIRSMSTRPGKMIVAHNLSDKHLPIKVFSTENWMVLKEFSYPTFPSDGLQYVHLCHENLVLKEYNKNVLVIDIWDHGNETTIENSKQERFLCFGLNAKNVLLAFENGIVVTCNSRGEQVRLHDDARNNARHSILHMATNRDKNLAILCSSKLMENTRELFYKNQAKTINICNTFNGKSIVKVNPCNNLDLTAATLRDSGKNKTHEALQNITALFYDDHHHKIYTGNSSGFIHVWSN